MNRAQARERVAELLAWQRAEMLDGRCPKCEAVVEPIGEAPEEWATKHAPSLGAPEGVGFRGEKFTHADDCPLANANERIIELAQRFGLRLEPEYIPAPRLSGTRVRVMRLVDEEES